MDNKEGWERLAAAVKRRREDRGWTQLEVATRGPLSIDRIQAIESVRTDRYSGRTLTALERGLEWESGSVRAILAGGQPTAVGDRRLADTGRATDDLTVTRDDDAELDELIEQAKVQRDRGDSTLYDTLMAVKRMNEARRQVHASDARVDRGSQESG